MAFPDDARLHLSAAYSPTNNEEGLNMYKLKISSQVSHPRAIICYDNSICGITGGDEINTTALRGSLKEVKLPVSY